MKLLFQIRREWWLCVSLMSVTLVQHIAAFNEVPQTPYALALKEVMLAADMSSLLDEAPTMQERQELEELILAKLVKSHYLLKSTDVEALLLEDVDYLAYWIAQVEYTQAQAYITQAIGALETILRL